MANIKYEIELQNKEVGIWRFMNWSFRTEAEARDQIENMKAMDRIMGYDGLEYRITKVSK